MMMPSSVTQYNGHIYGNFPSYYDFNPSGKRTELLRGVLVREVLATHEKSAFGYLDVGCNDGTLTYDISRLISSALPEGTEVVTTGVDIDPVLIERAIKQYPTREQITYEWKAGDILDGILSENGGESAYRPSPGTLSLISCFSTTMWLHLHHGDSGLTAFLREGCKWLKRGGLFLVEPQENVSYKKANRRLRQMKVVGEKDDKSDPNPTVHQFDLENLSLRSENSDVTHRIKEIILGEGFVEIKIDFERKDGDGDGDGDGDRKDTRTHWNRRLMLFRKN